LSLGCAEFALEDDLVFAPENALLSVEEVYRADTAAVAAGVSSETLMENAGASIVSIIQQRWSPCPVAVLCGPGNNGGDGFVVARLLAEAGWPVRLALLGEADRLQGDAKANALRWTGPVEPFTPGVFEGAALVIDAVFGAGLTRDLGGAVLEMISAIGERDIVAVDVPSGVHGDSGAVLGAAPRANLTVTFFRRKPGHLLLPGRAHCGEVLVTDIGIPVSVLTDIEPAQAANGPQLWLSNFPWPRLDDHKYSRGHAVVTGGRHMTGAARLAARAAQRIGAGMVTALVPNDAFVVYKIALTSALVRSFLDTGGFAESVSEPRVTACLVGPGNEISVGTRERALAALRTGKPVVLDADAITSFDDARALLFDAIAGPCVMTPHDGEFSRLFDITGDKLSRARKAAAESGAVIVLKGPDTVIAAPDGRAVINDNAPADLATGGSGDVLAGIVTGLIAQGQDAFEAACAAVWIHGASASRFGPGLVAEDIIETIPAILRQLKHSERSDVP
jgi:hydroxyethylthiazole kinase-like uncharacterized protein yjeF